MVGVCTGSSVVLPVSVDGRRGDSRAVSWLCVCLVQGNRCGPLVGHFRVLFRGFSLQCPVLHSTNEVQSGPGSQGGCP